jgi:DNA-binding transcriptional LysR family regulator
VRVHVEYHSANEVYEKVLSNAADVGLVAYPVKDQRLMIVPMRQEPLVLICSPDHPFAKLKSIKLKALNGQQLISFEPDTPARKALDKAFNEQGVTVHRSMEFDSVETVKRAVEINAGISLVPLSTVTVEIERQSLALVEISDSRFFRPTAAIYKMRRELSPALKQFLETLKDGNE